MTTTVDHGYLMHQTKYAEIDISAIHESTHNPRRHFDEAKLRELADNIATVGILTPLLVRPNAKGYEIAAGHRRYRAAKLAKLPLLPCLVREMSDREFMEVLNIENLQREGLHPLDEAKGYAMLMAAPYTTDVQKIAEKVGRSVKYVYDRVKLLALTKELQTLFWDDRITAGHAILLARLSPADQQRCVAHPHGLMRAEQTLYDTDEELEDKRPFAGMVACSVRELNDWIARHVRFDPKQADRMLFPETVQAVAAATEDQRKIVPITHEYLASDDVRAAADQRVYGERAWRRADGKEGSKPCEYAALGVIASGADYGQAFDVCTRKDKCLIHWGSEIKAREKARKQGPAAEAKAAARQESQWEKEQKARRAKEAQWKAALPKILAHVAKALQTMPVKANSPLGTVLCKLVDSSPRPEALTFVKRGTTAEDLVRHALFLGLHEQATGYMGYQDFPKWVKPLGIDVSTFLKAEPLAVQTSAPKQGKKKGRVA